MKSLSRFALLLAPLAFVSTAMAASSVPTPPSDPGEPDTLSGIGCAGYPLGQCPTHSPPAIIGGHDDVNTPEANVVVSLAGCSGTLLTPTVVLTANHCLTGKTLAGDVTVGASWPEAGYHKTWWTHLLDTNTPAATYADSVYVYGQYGADLAIVYLDPQTPAFEVNIVRPSLASPHPQASNDANGGEYDGPVGIAGYSANPDGKTAGRRQLAWINSLFHYPGAAGQYWEHDSGSQAVFYGDSGGPLFFVRADGTRDVVGVSSWMDSGASYWTDITRGAPRDWVRQHVVDTTRSSAWLQRHGIVGEYWKGEVDYWGECNHASDRDCDHWLDQHDNCPDQYNPDQKDDGYGGRGLACVEDIWGPIEPISPTAPPCLQTCTLLPNGTLSCHCGGGGYVHKTGS